MAELQSLLHLINKAKQLVYGEQLLKALKQKKVALLLISSTTSETSKKMWSQKAFHYQVPTAELKEALFISLFKKTTIKAIGITNKSFSEKIITMLN